ncbi:MAG: hypothetical protein AB9Q23_05960 [Candidatus Reddybacter sp.]
MPLLAGFFTCLCESALAAADFAALVALGFLIVLEAALAAFFEVTFLGALVWESALPAALFALADAVLERTVLDALFAALGRVTFLVAIYISIFDGRIGITANYKATGSITPWHLFTGLSARRMCLLPAKTTAWVFIVI